MITENMKSTIPFGTPNFSTITFNEIQNKKNNLEVFFTSSNDKNFMLNPLQHPPGCSPTQISWLKHVLKKTRRNAITKYLTNPFSFSKMFPTQITSDSV